MLTLSTFCKSLILALGLIMAGSSYAECSDAKVKRLHDRGDTIRSIAETCDMEKHEIREILSVPPKGSGGRKGGGSGDGGDGGDSGDSGDKLPSGTDLGQCGCWSVIHASARRPAPQCQSGVARPLPCPGWCPPNGGSPWRDTCA